MTQLGDGAAIARQRHGPAMHHPIEEPALDRVVVAGAHDVGGSEAGECNALATQPGLGFGLAGVATGGIQRAVLIQRPEFAVGIDASGADIHEAMAGRPGALDHGAGIGLAAPGAVDDHIEATPLQLLQTLGAAAIPLQVFHTGRHGIATAAEQGERMAGGLQPLHQWSADEASAAHHQDFHAITRCRAPKPAAIQAPGEPTGAAALLPCAAIGLAMHHPGRSEPRPPGVAGLPAWACRAPAVACR